MKTLKDKIKIFIEDKEIQERFNKTGLNTKKLNRFISYIMVRYIFNNDESIQIHSSRLREIDANYKEYLDYLSDEGILYINKHFVPGEKTRKYGFTNEFKKYTYKLRILIDKDFEKNKKTGKRNVVDTHIKLKLLSDYKKITKIKQPELTYENNIPKWKRWLRDTISQEMIFQNNLYRWRGNRLYTSYSRCSSDTRLNCFSINDNKLSTIDIKSSFPKFLALYLNKTNNSAENSGTDSEIKQFTRDVMEGDFYESLRREYNKNMHLFYKEKKSLQDDNDKTYYEFIDGKSVKIEYYSRRLIKRIFQMIINGDWLNKDGEVKKCKTVYSFYIKYSIIFQLIQEDKDNVYDILEELESDFLFNKLIKRLYSEIPSIRILTCHDQIYFESKYYDKAKEIYNEEIDKLFGDYYKKESYDKVELNDIGIEKSSYKDIYKEKEKKKEEEKRRRSVVDLDGYLDSLL